MLFTPKQKGQGLIEFAVIMVCIALLMFAFVALVVIPALPQLLQSDAPEIVKEIAKAILEAIGNAGN